MSSQIHTSQSNNKQQEASDPLNSVWVSASAGTGKTKILIDRILRLLLSGARPQKILCLTFTNAAATEMHNRLTARLRSWAFMEDDLLKQELYKIAGHYPSLNELSNARGLYNNLLAGAERIGIYTIHSFCQKLLKKFPLESGISPGFQIIGDIQMGNILSQVKNKIYLEANNDQLIRFFAANFHEVTINELLEEILDNRLKLSSRVKDYDTIDFKPKADEKEIFEALRLTLENFIFDDDAEIFTGRETIDELISFFLTKDGKKKDRIIVKKIADKYPGLLEGLKSVQDKIYTFDQENKISQMFEYTRLVVLLADTFINQYENYKKENSLLDYHDLIYLSNKLLTEGSSRDWVLYKLDGGIDHLLVDEAQDTSKEQWEIITALIEEFYAGEGGAQNDRSIFVVGDDKQSIFSFQGANLDSFTSMNQSLKQKLIDANKSFKVVSLDVSYRSCESILDCVHNVFTNLKNKKPELFAAENPKISPFKDHHSGKLEIWPLVVSSKQEELFWPLPEEHHKDLPEKVLASKITAYIRQRLKDDNTLRPSDFMILVRTRDRFTHELIDQLMLSDTPVAGIDRMSLSDNLTVLDCISAAKFALSPEDDLNLACLLKSPIIGLSEELLYKLAFNRREKSLWNILNEQDSEAVYHSIIKKLKFLMGLSKETTVADFFDIMLNSLGIRKVLNKASEIDSNDAINELLYLSSNYESKIDNSLQSFIYWFEDNNIEIKRDIENEAGIRVMTAHASKGLQSKIVILADTTSMPIYRERLVWVNDNRFLTVQQSSDAPEVFKNLKEKQKQKQLEEHCRLLYVAMTRAEENLIICGYSSNRSVNENSWYKIVSDCYLPDDILIDQESAQAQDLSQLRNSRMPALIKESIPDEWLIDEAQFQKELGVARRGAERTLVREHRSSKLRQRQFLKLSEYTTKAVNSPFYSKGHLEYGRHLHKILEDSLSSGDISQMTLHPIIKTLDELTQDKVIKVLNRLAQNEEFCNLLSCELKTELSIGAFEDNSFKTGRIDLLAIQERQITIIDYKSDSNPPERPEQIPISYKQQLRFYKDVLQKLYPDAEILCKILWLETSSFSSLRGA
jgi:ATP-dependent helicase/nuclease subunit A